MAEVKRGYRKVTAIIPVATYETLKRQAEDNDREVGQQAAFLLRKVLVPKQGPGLVDELDGNGRWENGLEEAGVVEATVADVE